jgi:[acyl-carrier-protein] S-malonyltransferase
MINQYSLLFAGQGAQYVGMGKDFYDKYEKAKQIFDKADEVLGYKLSDICFSGSEQDINLTKYSQPAILTLSIAYLEVLKYNISDFSPFAVAGLSLGEYSALVAAKVLSFEDALKLVCERGRLMEQASSLNPGGMVSVIGLEKDIVKDICNKVESDTGKCCSVANLNCPGQIVISGDIEILDIAMTLAKENKAKLVIKLKVSGAFHSRLMESACKGLEQEINKYTFNKPEYKFISNVTAKETVEPEEIKRYLVEQLCSSVLWEDSVSYISNAGCKKFIEIGPGNVLKGLGRRINRELNIINIDQEDSIDKIKEFIC